MTAIDYSAFPSRRCSITLTTLSCKNGRLVSSQAPTGHRHRRRRRPTVATLTSHWPRPHTAPLLLTPPIHSSVLLGCWPHSSPPAQLRGQSPQPLLSTGTRARTCAAPSGPFHTFLEYLQKTNVLETFQNQANNTKEGITIFVPKDSAFAALKKTTFANLTQDQLKSLILYHAFPKYYSLAEFNKLSTLNPVDKVLLPMQIFKSDPPLAPAPAPAPDAKASDVAPSPTSGKAASAKAKADEKNSSTNRDSCEMEVEIGEGSNWDEMQWQSAVKNRGGDNWDGGNLRQRG
ncbi:hypothetical protein HU200_009303 [Digitaria exilis]|uniref:FAS1 domain-containing protein n=1 Tax=Digitaria exilis TaxID=1010633 RepID=A0A835FJR0_9POAL|nr:hypothetical protein HU200_009303 [Digitaria exilis]